MAKSNEHNIFKDLTDLRQSFIYSFLWFYWLIYFIEIIIIVFHVSFYIFAELNFTRLNADRTYFGEVEM